MNTRSDYRSPIDPDDPACSGYEPDEFGFNHEEPDEGADGPDEPGGCLEIFSLPMAVSLFLVALLLVAAVLMNKVFSFESTGLRIVLLLLAGGVIARVIKEIRKAGP